ncbi:coiled-coil domain-containing protein 106b isoform X2 [Clupea harengus]|uniref:Coiled-coil domain-containing protein 106b isoform X2 n=1 Tax=Clupea harengus TaxID=7950 RepID=A0A6P8GS90_CLUHA|nr:coiled-coil domain-containing protein 106b isoform X2 [Clupea harengus]XP_031442030.1 coiled-coil domain-containing protein 106b isoform X2 [Clupea harengus]
MMTNTHPSTKTSTDSLMKNEGSYEISIPFEDNNGDQTNYFNQSQQPFEDHPSTGQQAPCDSYLLISNLRMQLQISLEKNSWLQKRIEDLEEERDFLRCQLERFINFTKSQELNDRQAEPPQASPQKTPSRRPSSPFPTPMTTRSSVSRQQASRKRPSSVQGELVLTLNTEQQSQVFQKLTAEEDYEDVVEEYLEEDGYLEEEEMLSFEEDGKMSKKGRSGGNAIPGTRVKRTRVFRIKRGMERQRVKDPAGVLIRYKKILVTYQKLKSMSKAFQVHGVDRNTVASTTPIAELLLVAPEKVPDVGEFDPSKEKLLDYARRCYKALDEASQAKVQALKKNNLLLPISYRFRN